MTRAAAGHPVTFTAPCPHCHQPCPWQAQRIVEVIDGYGFGHVHYLIDCPHCEEQLPAAA